MPLLGAHMSISGGYYRAAELAHQHQCDCVQLFTKNNNQWKAKEISPDEAARFRAAIQEHQIRAPIAHDSYLINLASPDDELWNKSVDAFTVELQRAEQLGLEGVVAHPGAFTTSSESEGLARIIRALDLVHERLGELNCLTLLENTAGQGSNLGWRLEHLAAILAGVKHGQRLGVCIDTCHLLAAGYPLASAAEYQATIAELDQVIGLNRVKAFHVNDSKTPLGSRVDRHEHIGQGHLGLEPFRRLLNDPRFQSVPMYLETAKETIDGEDMDDVNLRTLRGLIEAKS